jgi:hypothetical protein
MGRAQQSPSLHNHLSPVHKLNLTVRYVSADYYDWLERIVAIYLQASSARTHSNAALPS